MNADRIDAIVANLHRRYSGVTATSRMVAPRLVGVNAVWLGSDAPDGIARLSVGGLVQLWRRKRPLVWHARRNDEMIAGVVLRALGWPLKLVFTSAAQRHHSWTTRWLIRRMDRIIATSAISAGYLKRDATVIMHGVDVARYAPPPDRAAAFAEAGLPGKRLAGCFGRVRAQKGTDLFVDAMLALLPRYPDVSAVIVGAITPEYAAFAQALREKIAAAGLQDRIRITGEVGIDAAVAWFRRLSVFAFTSRNEGFGLTLIEAMACGAAVVATRAGAAELVIADGDTGVLVPVDDAAALAAALEPLLADPAAAEAMGARARAGAIAEFSIDTEAAAISAVYREMLG